MDDRYKKPRFELDDYVRVIQGKNEGRIGKVIQIRSYDSGLTPVYTLSNMGEYHEFQLQYYCK